MASNRLYGEYAGKKVLVTGHTGFKGGWLVAWLHQLGAEVHGFSLKPGTNPNIFEAAKLQALMASHTLGDIIDAAAVDRVVSQVKPDVIFHLAAQAIVRDSYTEPRATFEVNAMGTVNVLDAVRKAGRPCAVVVVTSDKCYENVEQQWGYRECDAMGGHDPYSASKGVAELIVSSYRSSFFSPGKLSSHGVRVASGRAGNVIGGGDWANARILTDAAKSLSQGQKIQVRSPKAIRPWQHVLDPVSGYLALGAKMLSQPTEAKWCSAWNFGPLPSVDVPVARIVEMFIAAWGSGAWHDASDPNQLHEARVLRLCIDKSLGELAWQPRFDVHQAVALTAAWYRKFYADPNASMRDAVLADIAQYTQQTTPR